MENTGCALMGPLAILLQSGLAALALATLLGKATRRGGEGKGAARARTHADREAGGRETVKRQAERPRRALRVW